MSTVIRVRSIRNFRLRHNISLQEVAEAAGKSCQWINQLEMGNVPLSTTQKMYILDAFQTVIRQKRKAQTELENEFAAIMNGFFAEERPCQPPFSRSVHVQ